MKKPILFKLPPALLARLEEVAKREDTSKTQLVEEGLSLILDKYEKFLEKEKK